MGLTDLIVYLFNLLFDNAHVKVNKTNVSRNDTLFHSKKLSQI